MNKFLRGLAMTGMMTAAAAVGGAAQAESGAVSVGVTGGTLGIGPEVGYRFGANIGLRANATFLSIHHGYDSDDLSYTGKIRLKSVGAMLDFFPGGGGFRISAGLRSNGNRARVSATPTTTVEINDTDYTPAQVGTLTGRAHVRDVAPALTLGYGGALRPGLTFGVEAGALFQGRVRIENFTASGGGVSQSDLDAERASIQDDVNKYKVYPVAQLSIAYRF